MANAVVGDWGDTLPFATGQDLTGWTELYVYITKPDGTLVTKTTVDGVTDNSAPTQQIIYYTIEEGLLNQDGVYRCSSAFETADGFFSAGGYDTYTVVRRNQSE